MTHETHKGTLIEVPDEIWAIATTGVGNVNCIDTDEEGGTSYTRTDIHQALLDENKKLFKALENATLRPYEERDQLRAENKAMREALEGARGSFANIASVERPEFIDAPEYWMEKCIDEAQSALTKINQVIGG